MRKVGILLILLACSKNELTREEAKRLLSEKSDYPRQVGSEIATKEELDEYLGKRWFKTEMPQGRVLVAECIETVEEVTGVSVEGTQATVEYRTKYERNPLRGSPCSDKPVHKALFQKFDDGWRVDMPRAME